MSNMQPGKVDPLNHTSWQRVNSTVVLLESGERKPDRRAVSIPRYLVSVGTSPGVSVTEGEALAQKLCDMLNAAGIS